MLGVIGATGQVGRELVSILKNGSMDFCALVRNRGRAKALLGHNINVRDFDFNDPRTFSHALHGLTKIFLVVDRGENLDLFLIHAQNKQVELIVFMSGLGAERRPHGPLRKAEILLEDSHIKLCSLKANWFMQNFTGMFLEDIKNGLLKLPAGDAKTSFVDARDIAEAAYSLFQNPPCQNSSFEITGPKAYSHEEVVSLISDTKNVKTNYRSISDHEAKEYYSWDDQTISLFHDMHQGFTKKLSPDLEILLKKPARTLEHFVLEHQQLW